MHDFKIANFLADRPTATFPQFTTIPEPMAHRFKEQWAARMGLDTAADALAVLLRMRELAHPVTGNAQSEDFNVMQILRGGEIKPQGEVYINWYRFTEIDRMSISDLSGVFEYVWYPGPDDIEVFDDTLSWFLSVDHSGYLSIYTAG